MRPLLLSLCVAALLCGVYIAGYADLRANGLRLGSPTSSSGRPRAEARRTHTSTSAGEQLAQAAAPAGVTVLSAAGRRPLRATVVNDHDMVALDELAPLFQLALREDALAGGMSVSYKGKSVVVMADQAIASVGGRLVSLPAPVVRDGKRWLVPVEFVSRALTLIYDSRIDYRAASHLVVVGDLRVPRLVVRQEMQGNQARVTFDTVPKTAATVAQDQKSLVVRFEADALDTVLPVTNMPGLAEGIRIVEPGNSIAIALGPRFASFRASTPPTDAAAARLIVDLLPALPGAGPVAPVPQLPPPSAAQPNDLPPLQTQQGGLRTIAIDPGHGGTEEGARGPTGVLEKDVTLNVARRLKGLLESRLGVRVLLTRDGDNAIPLDDRASVANNNKADLFVSIHASASLRKELKGAEVFYLNRDAYGQAEQQPPATALPVYGGGSRDIDVVRWEIAQTGHVAQSSQLASLVEEELHNRVPMAAHPIEQAPLRVLVGANMPAVLVEIGFLTNAEQEQALAGGDFQNVVAQALFDAIVRFRDGGRSGAVTTTGRHN